MKYAKTSALLGVVLSTFSMGAADAAVILVGDSTAGIQAADRITVSTTWTSNNVYRLQDQIYVESGATLTIQAGTVIASTPANQGSLAICRGAKIFALGTQENPIIFTSTADVATWLPLAGHPTGKNPKTGTWREAANEWGNVTIMGRAYISKSIGVAGNSATFNANNVAPMEGIVLPAGNNNGLYGGGDDNDDSGTLRYVSFRYGGKVVGLTNELNGLSLGGLGRETDIHHIDIMNNVDDGIEIWGGTVSLKYVNIWNIGDDSFDIDQGWRGKAQFGLLVQGYSVDAAQGSGVGDNLVETDGAENSDAQPVTTAVIYNFTALGQPTPGAGDHGTAWRDNARIQYRNCIFMNLGERLIGFDNLDGDGSQGYGFNGTLSWANTWTTNFNAAPAHANDPANPALFYTTQTSGKLAEITDSIFYQNPDPAAYTESDARGVTIAGGNNAALHNVVANLQPIATINRGPAVVKGGKTMLPVIGLDPRAINAASPSFAQAPNDGFFTPALYRGAFSATKNWLCGWTAADAFGYIIQPAGACKLPCPGDLDSNNTTNVNDLLGVINAWGVCLGCPQDINGDGQVNVVDLLGVINGWGACP